MTNSTARHSHCARCGRVLRDPRSIAAGVGPKCAKRIATAALVTIAHHKPEQVAKATELIADGGIARVAPGTFESVSSSGTEVYTTTTHGCSCKAGTFGRTCYHRVAAELIAA
jgi:Family of unknown function (DUF6011)